MKALREIGLRRAIRFAFWTPIEMALTWCIFPQIRVFLLRRLGAKIGKDTLIMRVRFDNLDRMGLRGLKIGSGCWIGNEVLLDLAGEITLGDKVVVGPRVNILTHHSVGHKDHPLYDEMPPFVAPVKIGYGCNINTGATILPGVRIFTKAVIAAGAMVTKRVPYRAKVKGVPAR